MVHTVAVADATSVAVSVPGVPTVGEAAWVVAVEVEVAAPVVLVGTTVMMTVPVRVAVGGAAVFVRVAVAATGVFVLVAVRVAVRVAVAATEVFVRVAVAASAVLVAQMLPFTTVMVPVMKVCIAQW